jgi:alpha-1,2-mannosyltransferase
MTITSVRAARRSPRTMKVCALILVLGLAVLVFDAHYRFFDMVIYHDAIRWWRSGGDLYDYVAPVRGRLGFTYPPFAALLLLPVASVPPAVAGWLNVAVGIGALAVVLAVAAAPIAARHGWRIRSVLAVALPLALLTEPVRQTLGFGQVNLALLALVVVDLAVLRGSAWTGVGVGLATAIKITPGLFLVYLLVTRQWRALWTALGTVAALTACGFLIAPAESTRYFGELLWQTGRVGATDAIANQSLAGLLARAAAPAGWWSAAALVMLVAGLRRARAAHLAGDEIAALTLIGLTANLISPMSWTHHLVFLPVAILVLVDVTLRTGDPLPGAAALAGYALSVVAPIWLVPDHLDRVPALILQNSFTLLLIALVLLLPHRGLSPGDPPVIDRHRCLETEPKQRSPHGHAR